MKITKDNLFYLLNLGGYNFKPEFRDNWCYEQELYKFNKHRFQRRIDISNFDTNGQFIVETLFPILIEPKDFVKVADAFNEWSMDNYDVHFILDYDTGETFTRSALDFSAFEYQYPMIENALISTGNQAGQHYPSLLKLLGKK
ncbi:MAG: hypothetical protein MUC49_22770 [Raineya sp.]|jgi:hypothetical protein|nr:hypothetical protein [Raineya sp.]